MEPRTMLPVEPPVTASEQSCSAANWPASLLHNALSAPLFAALHSAGLLQLPPPAGRAAPHLAVAWHPTACRVAYLSGDKVLTPTLDNVSLAGESSPVDVQHTAPVALAWRPNAKASIAVAGRSGLSLYCFGEFGRHAGPHRSMPPSVVAKAFRQVPLCTSEAVSALSWSPDGQFLAAGSPGDSAFSVWDVATRTRTRLRCAVDGARILRWSPLGNYLLVAGQTACAVEIWETHSWTSTSWSTSGGHLSDAAWSANEEEVILSVTSSTQLAVLKFVGEAPSLAAKLVPLDLPVAALHLQGSVTSLCFDSTAGKLAVAFLGDAEPSVCVFALQTKPACEAHLVGRLTPPALARTLKVASPQGPGLAFRHQLGSGASGSVLALAVAWPGGGVGVYTA